MVTGIASVNDLFPTQDTQCIVMSYDYMVLAGTQGLKSQKGECSSSPSSSSASHVDCRRWWWTTRRWGRCGIAGLDCLAFQQGELSGLVRVGITTGRCFAGNAGASDVVIATEDSNIGMGGPLIEGGGLGVFTPRGGPYGGAGAQCVVDISVKDEAEAMQMARKYLSYFQGPLDDWECADQRHLRHAIPENRLRVYDIRALVKQLVDKDSLLELRKDFGLGMIAAFARMRATHGLVPTTQPSCLVRLIATAQIKPQDSFSFAMPLTFRL